MSESLSLSLSPSSSSSSSLPSPSRLRRFTLIGLIGLVGIAPWLLINGLFAQLPIFIAKTPETFNIASYIVLLTQVGNGVAALFVAWLAHFGERWTPQQRAAVCARAIFVILVLEIVASGAIAFLWNSTINGNSAAIMLATVAGGISGCLSVILVYPFTAPLQPIATIAMSTGMGLNGLVTALLAIIQAPSQENRFDTTTFFLIITAVLVASLVAFLYLWLTDAATAVLGVRVAIDPHAKPLIGGHDDVDITDVDSAADHIVRSPSSSSDHDTRGGDAAANNDSTLLRAMRTYWGVCAHQVAICFMQYVLMSLFSFATAAFANQGAILLYANVCGNIFGPLARALSGVVELRTPRWLAAMTAIVGVLSVLLFAATFAVYMPGEVLALLSVLLAVVFGFEETTLFTKVAVEAPGAAKAAASRAVGIANQIGACGGSLVGFGIAYSLAA